MKILPSVGESRKTYPRDQWYWFGTVCVSVLMCVQANTEPHVTNIGAFGLRRKCTSSNILNDIPSYFMKISV